jgi:segregation and condensation protein A
VYEGPFELLLHLILKEEVDIWDVKIAEVIDAFLVEVGALARVDLDVATEFLLIASTLVELKVRRLLPGSEMTELDEELLRFEERDLLLARLLECKTFKGAPACSRACCSSGKVVSRSAGVEEPFRSLAPTRWRVTPRSSRRHSTDAIAVAARGRPDHVAPIRLSVRDAADALLVQLRHRAGELPGAGRRDRRSPRGDRAVPRRARALQAGHHRRRQVVTFGDLTVRRLSEPSRSSTSRRWTTGRPVRARVARGRRGRRGEDAELGAMVVAST